MVDIFAEDAAVQDGHHAVFTARRDLRYAVTGRPQLFSDNGPRKGLMIVIRDMTNRQPLFDNMPTTFPVAKPAA